MKMPASFAEFSDALQKARIKDGSFCKNELTCIHYNGLTHAMIGWNANLYDLNLFAQRLASLTEEQKKGMDALLKIKQNHRVAPIPLNQLINLTYNTDICCFAPRVSNHEELGAFLYANEMLSNEAMALLDTTEEGSGFQERLLELLGEQHQEDHGGVFTDFGYMSDRLLTIGNTTAALDELYVWLSDNVSVGTTIIEYIRNTLKRVRKKESNLIMASQNLEDFDREGIRELTKPLFAIPPHQFIFNCGSIDKRFYMDLLQLEEAEYNLIRFPQRGVCLFKCGNERYLLEVHAPAYKEALFGTAGGR